MRPSSFLRHVTCFVKITFCLIFCLVFQNSADSQSIDFCGVLPSHEANTSNPDSILYDRFGNSYDLNDFDNSSGSQTLCGYFELDFNGIDLNLRGTICGVFSDISDLIEKRSNIPPCGTTVISEPVRILVNYDTTLNYPVAASGSPYYSIFSNSPCDDV